MKRPSCQHQSLPYAIINSSMKFGSPLLLASNSPHAHDHPSSSSSAPTKTVLAPGIPLRKVELELYRGSGYSYLDGIQPEKNVSLHVSLGRPFFCYLCQDDHPLKDMFILRKCGHVCCCVDTLNKFTSWSSDLKCSYCRLPARLEDIITTKQARESNVHIILQQQ